MLGKRKEKRSTVSKEVPVVVTADGSFGMELAHQIGGFRFGILFNGVVSVLGGVYGDLGVFFQSLVNLVDGLLGAGMATGNRTGRWVDRMGL